MWSIRMKIQAVEKETDELGKILKQLADTECVMWPLDERLKIQRHEAARHYAVALALELAAEKGCCLLAMDEDDMCEIACQIEASSWMTVKAESLGTDAKYMRQCVEAYWGDER